MHADQRDLSADDGGSLIEQTAADWLILHDRGLNPAQQQEFERWLRSDERHAAVYAELAETWSLVGQVRDVAPLSVPFPTAIPRRHNRRLFLSLAAAASVALAFFLARPAATPASDFRLTASTEVGVMRKLSLPDGSWVQLNTDSAIAVQFTAGERRVQLVRGEAHFQVAKNPACPFVVNAGAVNVRAVGTAFDVRRRPEAVEVLVTEGKVQVNDSVEGRSRLPARAAHEGPAYLVAGERAYISTGATDPTVKVVAVAPLEIGQVLAWQSHRLEFVATPLAEMVEEFNRYNRHKLVIADPRLAARRFGGTFPAGDYEEFVRLLESNFGVVAERDQHEIRLRLAP